MRPTKVEKGEATAEVEMGATGAEATPEPASPLEWDLKACPPSEGNGSREGQVHSCDAMAPSAICDDDAIEENGACCPRSEGDVDLCAVVARSGGLAAAAAEAAAASNIDPEVSTVPPASP